MRKPAFILTAFIILLFSFQTSGFCTNWYAGAQAGPEFLTSGDDYDLDTAIAFGIYGGYKFDKLVSLEANLITATHDGKGDSELNVTSLLLGPRLTGRVTKDMDIYADAGFGVYILDLDLGPYDRSDTKAASTLPRTCGQEPTSRR